MKRSEKRLLEAVHSGKLGVRDEKGWGQVVSLGVIKMRFGTPQRWALFVYHLLKDGEVESDLDGFLEKPAKYKLFEPFWGNDLSPRAYKSRTLKTHKGDIEYVAYCTSCRKALECTPNSHWAEGVAAAHTQKTSHPVIVGTSTQGVKKVQTTLDVFKVETLMDCMRLDLARARAAEKQHNLQAAQEAEQRIGLTFDAISEQVLRMDLRRAAHLLWERANRIATDLKYAVKAS